MLDIKLLRIFSILLYVYVAPFSAQFFDFFYLNFINNILTVLRVLSLNSLRM